MYWILVASRKCSLNLTTRYRLFEHLQPNNVDIPSLPVSKADANPKAVITVLRVPQVFSSLGLFVSEVIPDASDSSQFTVTDSIPIISSLRVRTTYKVSVEMHADRFTGRPATGLGTKTESNFCTKVGKDDGGDTKFYGYCELFRFHMFRETYLQTLGFFSIRCLSS